MRVESFSSHLSRLRVDIFMGLLIIENGAPLDHTHFFLLPVVRHAESVCVTQGRCARHILIITLLLRFHAVVVSWANPQTDGGPRCVRIGG